MDRVLLEAGQPSRGADPDPASAVLGQGSDLATGQAFSFPVPQETGPTAADQPAGPTPDPDVPFAILIGQARLREAHVGKAGREGMPLLPVVHQDASAGHPQPAPAVHAYMPYPRRHDLRHLRWGAHVDQIEMLAPGIVAADDRFPLPVAGGDPQMVGRVLGKFPTPNGGLRPGEDRAQAMAIQADDPPGLRGQPGRARHVRGQVVHPTQRLPADLPGALHARLLGIPGDTLAREHAHGAIRLRLQSQDLIGRQTVLGGVHLESAAVEDSQPFAQGTKPQPPEGVLGNALHREMRQTLGRSEALEGLPVEPAHAAIGRGDPEQTSPVLVDVLDQHAGQPVIQGVLARGHVGQ